MHIPDGFLSPQTCVTCWAAATPVWIATWRALKRRFEHTTAAHIGVAAAFVFLLQMVNVPIPGGTTGHAVGAAMVAITLGPAAAILAVSMALALQAVVFGDGGIWAYGANVLSMAVIQSFVAWAVWRVIVRQNTSSKLQAIAAFAASYLAAVCGALFTGTLLGIQPLLFSDNAGTPLYFPLGLSVSVPAMLGAHMLIGVIEGSVTLGAMKALSRIPDFQMATPLPRSSRRWITGALAAAVLIVPAGILLPTLVGSGAPWGEWSPDEAAEIAGHSAAPAGMAKYAEKYNAPVPDYQFTPATHVAEESAQYIGAGLLGIFLVVLLCLPLHKIQQRRLQRMRQQ